MQSHTALAALLLLFCGCSALERVGGRTEGRRAPLESAARIPVQLWALPGVQVPVGSEGTSLRQAVAQARDQMGVAEAERFALNHAGTFEAVFGIPRDPELPRIRVGSNSEWMVLVRGTSRLFIPAAVINETSMGRIRIGSGDAIASVPNDSVINHGMWEDPETVASAIPVTTLGPFLDSRDLTLDPNSTLRDLLEFLTVPSPDGAASLGPNIAVVTRSSGAFVDRIFAPVRDGVVSGEPGRTVGDTFTDTIGLELLPGDSIQLTRLELIPEVLVALTAPPPPPVGPSTPVKEHCRPGMLERLTSRWR